MQLSWKPFTLEFKHPFRIAHGVRKTTPVVFTRIEHEAFTGYGEASMPPYLGETHESVRAFLRRVKLDQFKDPCKIDSIISYVDSLSPYNTAAKASVDIALHDLVGKILGKSVHSYYGIKSVSEFITSYTIGMDTEKIIRERIKEAAPFPILKIKLGGADDEMILNTVQASTKKQFSVDANQGWKNKEFALDMIHRLNEMNVLFVEQPLDKNNLKDHAWLRERSPLPIIADESCQRLGDIQNCLDSFHGINIKLMKCTGLYEAKKMIDEAKNQNLKILIGCMSETNCAVSAAAQLAPLADWVDLDGSLLITNNQFDGIRIESGKVILPELPGTGAVPKKYLFETGVEN